jgi:hypothetical protein
MLCYSEGNTTSLLAASATLNPDVQSRKTTPSKNVIERQGSSQNTNTGTYKAELAGLSSSNLEQPSKWLSKRPENASKFEQPSLVSKAKRQRQGENDTGERSVDDNAGGEDDRLVDPSTSPKNSLYQANNCASADGTAVQEPSANNRQNPDSSIFETRCWQCFRGGLSSQAITKKMCRKVLKHTGPDWQKDPREHEMSYQTTAQQDQAAKPTGTVQQQTVSKAQQGIVQNKQKLSRIETDSAGTTKNPGHVGAPMDPAHEIRKRRHPDSDAHVPAHAKTHQNQNSCESNYVAEQVTSCNSHDDEIVANQICDGAQHAQPEASTTTTATTTTDNTQPEEVPPQKRPRGRPKRSPGDFPEFKEQQSGSGGLGSSNMQQTDVQPQKRPRGRPKRVQAPVAANIQTIHANVHTIHVQCMSCMRVILSTDSEKAIKAVNEADSAKSSNVAIAMDPECADDANDANECGTEKEDVSPEDHDESMLDDDDEPVNESLSSHEDEDDQFMETDISPQHMCGNHHQGQQPCISQASRNAETEQDPKASTMVGFCVCRKGHALSCA